GPGSFGRRWELYTEAACIERRTRLLAPRTGDIRAELILELREYSGLDTNEIEDRLHGATQRFSDEWRRQEVDASDDDAVIRFYNESTTEVFDLAQWHATDLIHCRSVIAADLASNLGVRTVLDYGSGIGSDALVFAKMGMRVTLADVSAPL